MANKNKSDRIRITLENDRNLLKSVIPVEASKIIVEQIRKESFDAFSKGLLDKTEELAKKTGMTARDARIKMCELVEENLSDAEILQIISQKMYDEKNIQIEKDKMKESVKDCCAKLDVKDEELVSEITEKTLGLIFQRIVELYKETLKSLKLDG